MKMYDVVFDRDVEVEVEFCNFVAPALTSVSAETDKIKISEGIPTVLPSRKTNTAHYSPFHTSRLLRKIQSNPTP